MGLSFTTQDYFSNKTGAENDYRATVVSERTLRENIVSAQVNIKQERGKILRIKNEKNDLEETYILKYLNNLESKVKNYKQSIMSINVGNYNQEKKDLFIQKLDKIESLIGYYIAKKDISQQEFTIFLKELNGQINTL